jgi:hypothetical protein
MSQPDRASRSHAASARIVSLARRALRRTQPRSDDDDLESGLVWIYGSPRTGSTWLLRMLCHPLKPNPEAPLGFSWPDAPPDGPLAFPVDEFLVSTHLVPFQGGTVEFGDTVFPATLNDWQRRRTSYAFSDEFADVWRPQARQLTLARLRAVVERAHGAGLAAGRRPFLVIKEVNGSHAADVVMSLFPRSRMIFLVRDGRDVVDSLLDANSAQGWRTKLGLGEGGFESGDERLEWVRERCRDWTARMNVCSQAYAAHDPALRRRVRYEDLLADTPGVLGELAQWIGLRAGAERIRDIAERHSFEAIPEEMKGSGKVRRSATPGGWRSTLTEDERRAAEAIMGERLAEYGYELELDRVRESG